VPAALDYLSPLPPVRSGISDYSVDLLPELSRLADVRVLRLEEQAVDEAIADRFGVREPAARAGEGGRLPLYQMGNNHYHERIWELALARPGIVVLHDLVLHHFLLGRTVGRGDWPPYRDELAACHGWIGDAAARPVRFGAFGQASQFELPANRTLLARQRGVLVHGRWAAERLIEDDPRLAVRVVPMGIPLPAAAAAGERRAFRRRLGIPEAAPLLGSFGFQTPIKRTDVAIRALARPGLARVHLLVAGELSPYANFRDLATRLGVAARVHVTGFLPFEEMHAAIAAADLCLNLRYPSAGETSASLLRILAVGRPAIVSDYAELGDLPESIVLRVPLGDDEDERFVAAVAAALGGGAGELAAMGERARRHVEREHAPERAARAVIAAIEELARREPPGPLPASPPPRSSVACSRPLGAIEVRGHEAWAPGARRALEIELRNDGPATWLPSDVDPGGVIFEVQLLEGESVARRGLPWLRLQRPLAPGESVRVGLTMRRPLGEARLRILPKITLGAGYARFGDWSCVQWI
jgi:glycosyltransferase involved in cell wall biosynthesis